MKTGVLLALVVSWTATALPSDVVVLSDGTHMEVAAYEVRGNVVVVTTLEGGLRSLPLAYVDVEATARANAEAGATSVVTPAPPLAASNDSVVNARRASCSRMASSHERVSVRTRISSGRFAGGAATSAS